MKSVLRGSLCLCTPLIMIGYKKCGNNVENNGAGLKVLLQNNAGGKARVRGGRGGYSQKIGVLG